MMKGSDTSIRLSHGLKTPFLMETIEAMKISPPGMKRPASARNISRERLMEFLLLTPKSGVRI
jgi:hypothetical protein